MLVRVGFSMYYATLFPPKVTFPTQQFCKSMNSEWEGKPRHTYDNLTPYV